MESRSAGDLGHYYASSGCSLSVGGVYVRGCLCYEQPAHASRISARPVSLCKRRRRSTVDKTPTLLLISPLRMVAGVAPPIASCGFKNYRAILDVIGALQAKDFGVQKLQLPCIVVTGMRLTDWSFSSMTGSALSLHTTYVTIRYCSYPLAFALVDCLTLKLVVCISGHESCGKSSLLEAISGVRLPTGREVTTRCPIQLLMKRGPAASGPKYLVGAQVVSDLQFPTSSDSPEPYARLPLIPLLCRLIRYLCSQVKWTPAVSAQTAKVMPDPVEAEPQSETELKDCLIVAMKDVTGTDKSINDGLIEVTVSAPHVPDLILVDLPGLISTASTSQSPDLPQKVEALVEKHLQGVCLFTFAPSFHNNVTCLKASLAGAQTAALHPGSAHKQCTAQQARCNCTRLHGVTGRQLALRGDALACLLSRLTA